jgi:hypothetical protein
MLTNVAQSQSFVLDADADTIKMQYLSLLTTTTSKSLSLGISFRTVVHVTFAKFCLLPPGTLRLSPRRPWLFYQMYSGVLLWYSTSSTPTRTWMIDYSEYSVDESYRNFR